MVPIFNSHKHFTGKPGFVKFLGTFGFPGFVRFTRAGRVPESELLAWASWQQLIYAVYGYIINTRRARVCLLSAYNVLQVGKQDYQLNRTFLTRKGQGMGKMGLIY